MFASIAIGISTTIAVSTYTLKEYKKYQTTKHNIKLSQMKIIHDFCKKCESMIENNDKIDEEEINVSIMILLQMIKKFNKNIECSYVCMCKNKQCDLSNDKLKNQFRFCKNKCFIFQKYNKKNEQYLKTHFYFKSHRNTNGLRYKFLKTKDQVEYQSKNNYPLFLLSCLRKIQYGFKDIEITKIKTKVIQQRNTFYKVLKKYNLYGIIHDIEINNDDIEESYSESYSESYTETSLDESNENKINDTIEETIQILNTN